MENDTDPRLIRPPHNFTQERIDRFAALWDEARATTHSRDRARLCVEACHVIFDMREVRSMYHPVDRVMRSGVPGHQALDALWASPITATIEPRKEAP